MSDETPATLPPDIADLADKLMGPRQPGVDTATKAALALAKPVVPAPLLAKLRSNMGGLLQLKAQYADLMLEQRAREARMRNLEAGIAAQGEALGRVQRDALVTLGVDPETAQAAGWNINLDTGELTRKD